MDQYGGSELIFSYSEAGQSEKVLGCFGFMLLASILQHHLIFFYDISWRNMFLYISPEQDMNDWLCPLGLLHFLLDN